jgi:LEA14-like dessication related protein
MALPAYHVLMRTLRLLLAAPLLLAACHAAPQALPEVSLVDVRIGDVKVLESTVRVTVRLANPNPDPIVVDGGVHKLYINGVYVGDGFVKDRVEVPRLDSITQTVSVHVENLLLLSRLRPDIESRSFDYRLDSTLYVEGAGSHGARVSKEGRLSVGDIPGVKRLDGTEP